MTDQPTQKERESREADRRWMENLERRIRRQEEAGPELLQALDAILDGLKTGYIAQHGAKAGRYRQMLEEQARAAIAKAGGV